MAGISEQSNIKLSLVVSLVAAVGSMFWWARGIQSATDSSSQRVDLVERVQREDIRVLREALKELQHLNAQNATQIALIVNFLGANEMGPPKRLRKRTPLPDEDD